LAVINNQWAHSRDSLKANVRMVEVRSSLALQRVQLIVEETLRLGIINRPAALRSNITYRYWPLAHHWRPITKRCYRLRKAVPMHSQILILHIIVNPNPGRLIRLKVKGRPRCGTIDHHGVSVSTRHIDLLSGDTKDLVGLEVITVIVEGRRRQPCQRKPARRHRNHDAVVPRCRKSNTNNEEQETEISTTQSKVLVLSSRSHVLQGKLLA
jgi:hypothetical protein